MRRAWGVMSLASVLPCDQPVFLLATSRHRCAVGVRLVCDACVPWFCAGRRARRAAGSRDVPRVARRAALARQHDDRHACGYVRTFLLPASLPSSHALPSPRSAPFSFGRSLSGLGLALARSARCGTASTLTCTSACLPGERCPLRAGACCACCAQAPGGISRWATRTFTCASGAQGLRVRVPQVLRSLLADGEPQRG